LSLMTLVSRLLPAVAALLLVGCAAPVQAPPPQAAAFARPADGFLRVTRMPVDTSQGSAWGWRVRAPEGTWKVVCKYGGRSDGDRFSAVVELSGGRTLELPESAVSTACQCISRDPELEAWSDDGGRLMLRLHGMITGSTSEGVFAFEGRELDGWWLRQRTMEHTSGGWQPVEKEWVFDGDGRQLAP
jgi:hypothetical protein